MEIMKKYLDSLQRGYDDLKIEVKVKNEGILRAINLIELKDIENALQVLHRTYWKIK